MSHPLRLEQADRVFVSGQKTTGTARERDRLPRWQVAIFAVALAVSVIDGLALGFAPMFVSAPVEMALIGVLSAAMVAMAAIVKQAAVIRERCKPVPSSRETD